MKKQLWILGAAIFLLATQVPAITVDGYAYLSAQADHSGIRVLFTERSPSARTDSAFTNNSGYFSKDIQPGVYDVQYTLSGYAVYRLPTTALLTNTTLSPVTLMPPLSGNLSGTIGPGEFQVVDTFTVQQGQFLTILPGTRLFFEKDRSLIIKGTLQAIGTQNDSVVFTGRYSTFDSTWIGIHFDHAEGECRMEYCVVEYATPTGIKCTSSTVNVLFSTIRKNGLHYYSTDFNGGGIGASDGQLTLQNCKVIQNQALHNGGGGLYAEGVVATLTNCVFQGNRAQSGGGLFVRNGSVTMVFCIVKADTADTYGGGIYCHGSDTIHLFMDHCSIEDNWSRDYYRGGGVFSENTSPIFESCTFSRNHAYQGLAAYFQGGSPTLSKCTVSNNNANNSLLTVGGSICANQSGLVLNSSTICHTSYGPGVYLANSPNVVISYCDFFGNAEGDFGEENPLAFGQLITTNANGDSSDTYYNIFQDPMFVDTTNGDYHLLSGSPCIDAGDPDLQHDPDGTVADIGAFYYSQLGVSEERTAVRGYNVLSAYPNPFNAETRISFALPRVAEVRLDVFDITGRKVSTLVSGKLSAGEHSIFFDGSGLASGLYFCRLQADKDVQTKKVILLR